LGPSDKKFLALINAHDISGYKALYQRYYKPLAMHAEGIVGDILIAEDIVENVVVALWNGNMTFSDIKSFEAYLYRSVNNLAINERKHSNVVNAYEQHVISMGQSESDEYDEEYEIMLVNLMKHIDSLPQRMKDIANKSLQGMTSKEIAENLNISVETVKTHRKRALKMLRQFMNEQNDN